MKSDINKKSILLRFGFLGWLLYQKRGMKFEDNMWYVFRLYSAAFFLVFSIVASLLLLISGRKWIYIEIIIILISFLYGSWASKFFSKRNIKRIDSER
ncbi:hypothetical protein IGI43_003282 [Enterococcus sp. AZ126]